MVAVLLSATCGPFAGYGARVKGLSRIGFGLALVSLGATVLFGEPVIGGWSGAPWDWIGCGLLLLGFTLLALGSVAAARDYSAQNRSRSEEAKRVEEQQQREIRSLQTRFKAESAKLTKLRYWQTVAKDYADEVRVGVLDAEISAAEDIRQDLKAQLEKLGHVAPDVA